MCALQFYLQGFLLHEPNVGLSRTPYRQRQSHLLSTQSDAHIHVLIINLQCRAKMPRIVAAWLRCYVMVNVVYFLTGGMWAYYVYVCWGDKFFAPGNMPALRDMGEQIKVYHHNMLNSAILAAHHMLQDGLVRLE